MMLLKVLVFVTKDFSNLGWHVQATLRIDLHFGKTFYIYLYTDHLSPIVATYQKLGSPIPGHL
jgi:hypothetical protein